MDSEKEVAMNQTYRQFMDAGLGLKSPMSLNDIVDDRLMGFGTTIDEKIFNVGELKELLARQKEQGKGINLRWDIKPLSHYTSTDENTAFFADDIFLHATIEGELIEMYLRFSVVLSYVNNQWKVIHWHGSKPENVQSEEDTFGIETWKQKAEALEKLVAERTADLKEKNRELEIETSLERVRTVAMSMHKPDDLLLVCKSLFAELKCLGFTEIRNALINTFNDEKSFFLDYDYSDFLGGHVTTISYDRHPLIEKHLKQIRKASDAFAETIVNEKELESWIEGRRANGEPEDPQLQNISALYYYFYSTGPAAIGLSTYRALSGEKRELLKRFRNVFELAYRRYADIQKAESQAREVQIELALERVRARTMAMQHSEELSETAAVLFEQFNLLGEAPERMAIEIVNEKENVFEIWATQHGGSQLDLLLKASLDEPHVMQKMYKAWKEQKKSITIDLQGKELEEYFLFLEQAGLPVRREIFGKRRVQNVATFSKGILTIITPEPRPAETIQLLERFAAVFDGTYTRFLDLQKAEAQSKEAQIQLALERVRARTMAMQRSDELMETAAMLFDQLMQLGENIERTIIGVMNEEERVVDFWATRPGGSQMDKMQKFPIDESIVLQKIYGAWRQQKKSIVIDLQGEELESYFQFLKARGPRLKRESFGERRVENFVFFSKGMLGVISEDPTKPANVELYERFAAVFDQTYTRFLDLQKAETQAREAQIEAALEKVRSRSLAMHKSDELQQVVNTVFEKLQELDIEMDSANIAIFKEGSRDFDYWVASDFQKRAASFHMPYIDLSLTRDLIAARETGTDFTAMAYSFEEKNQWFEYAFKNTDFRFLTGERKQFILAAPAITVSIAFSQYTGVQVIRYSTKLLSEKETEILKRFSRVFEQAYVRFLDLQKAEAQAREAQIETGLEKVRSRTLAMQKSDELAETAAVLFQQLILLGIAPNRLYINIVKDDSGEAEFWITDEDGTKVSSAVNTNMHDNNFFKKMFEGWKEKKKSLILDMRGDELKTYLQHLSSLHVSFKSTASQERRLQYLAYFNKGFIGMASPDEQPEGTMFLLERFAAVFNLTFTRFNDLQLAEAHALQAEEDLIKLKEEKQRTEQALAELQVTQKQLIHAEKMASLGELTAGIAHEIQNPLNFVNNFSEVNKELLAELKAEADKGNVDEVKAIANDVIDNSEKINHHGKRADAIVKGMLQHSRSSSGQKEPTNINALTDEYLRLAYHGLRAKDKSFNTTLQTEYDESIGNIEVIPQDIGRVILNLITNAFYAVAEKKSNLAVAFEPIVSVSTKKIKDNVQITVVDNGKGIPQGIVDKIFQPFFTTKPTGQGTGLGLSLAYDIVKAHGGELKVETKEGEGTKFYLSIPID